MRSELKETSLEEKKQSDWYDFSTFPGISTDDISSDRPFILPFIFRNRYTTAKYFSTCRHFSFTFHFISSKITMPSTKLAKPDDS